MKTNHIIWSLIVSTMILTSCKKFLDINRGNNQSFVTNANDCQLLLDNYEKMNTGYPCDGEISADDYFLLDITLAAQGSTFPQPEEKNLYSWLPNAQRSLAAPNWQNPYQTVYTANLVLENIEKIRSKGENPVTLNTLKGSALFYRAFCFWQIAQIYAQPYSITTATQYPGIPLRLQSDINDKSDRGTVQDTYDRIIQDLMEAVTLLPNTSNIASRPNKVAAYAMLARTYLSIGDYQKALLNADAALKIKNTLLNYNSISQSSSTPFSRFNNEVIFHSISTRSIILNPGTASSNIAKIDRTLAASYSPNDLRSRIFLKPNSGIHTGTFRFSGNYEPSTNSTFFNGLAVDELYLIRAECYARAGDLINSMKDLNDLLATRWVTNEYVNITAETPTEALSKILEERRKELLMRGLRWSDLRRLNTDPDYKKNLTRTIDGNGTIIATLPANDFRYTLLLPVEVINLAHIAQNRR